MKRLIFILGIITPAFLFSQNTIEEVLAEIEQNNTTLIALQKSLDAEKMGNKTGIFPVNPEFEFGYLWGNPSAIGTRTDLSISQTFDFPSAYKYRRDISKIKNQQAELEYEKQKKDILFQARTVFNELIYLNALADEYQRRQSLADSILQTYSRKLDAGETNLLEFNKSKLNALTAEKKINSIEIKRSAALSELTGLNGGVPIEMEQKQFPVLNVPQDFEQWYQLAEQKNPLLSWLSKEVEVSKNNVKLSKAMQLPKLQTGYMSEKTQEEHFQGVTLGMSIPLWENKNKVKQAQAQTEVIKSIATDNKIQFFNQLKTTHQKFYLLQKNVSEYKKEFRDSDNSSLLKKALNAGEINLIDYMLELSIYYESIDKIMEMEKDLNNAFAELNLYI